jgi:putative addiction module component (TIGR02574 family)
MSTDSSRILDAALALPVHERAELAERILDSLGAEPTEDRIARWAVETESRLDAIERGELRTRTAQEVFSRLRQRYS